MAFMNLAHRGASAYAPENTLAAFYKAVELGANGIELDLRATQDGVIVVFHDATVDRTTNGNGRVKDYTWDQLKSLDAGFWFSPQYAGERVITFHQFLYFFSRKPLYLAVELKEEGFEQQVCQLLQRYSLYDRCTITSFDYRILQTVRAFDPRVNIGFLTSKINQNTIDMILDIHGQQICPKTETLNKDEVHWAKQHGLTVRAWGIRDKTLMEHALQCRVDGMTVDFPDQLKERLRSDQTLENKHEFVQIGSNA